MELSEHRLHYVIITSFTVGRESELNKIRLNLENSVNIIESICVFSMLPQYATGSSTTF